MTYPNFAASVHSVIDSLNATGLTFIGKLGGAGGVGFKLLNALCGVMFLYNLVIFMLERDGKIMVDLTKLTITWAILAAMLVGWTSDSSMSVSKMFLNTIPAVADSFAPNPTDDIVSMHVDAVMNLVKVVTPPEVSSQTWGDRLIKALPVPIQLSIQASGIGGGSGNAMENSNMLSYLISVVLLLISAFFILMSLVTFVFVINAGQVMMYVGLALGPILIPFLLIPKLSFLFDGWLKFMISASLYKVVAVIVGLLAMGTITTIVTYAAQSSTASESLIFLSLMILFYSILAQKMMGLADNIASSLATGGSSAGLQDGGSTKIIFATAKTK